MDFDLTVFYRNSTKNVGLYSPLLNLSWGILVPSNNEFDLLNNGRFKKFTKDKLRHQVTIVTREICDFVIDPYLFSHMRKQINFINKHDFVWNCYFHYDENTENLNLKFGFEDLAAAIIFKFAQ